MTKTQRVRDGIVHPAYPHFLIEYSHEPDSRWHPVALLSYASTVEDLRLCLLQDLNHEILRLLHRELAFYLFEKAESDPIGYLLFHSKALANSLSKVHVSFCQGISLKKLGYYARMQALLKRIDIDYTQNCLKDGYLQAIMLNLKDMALEGEGVFVTEFVEKNLPALHKTVFQNLTKSDRFTFAFTPSLAQFVAQYRQMSLDGICWFLSYLKECGFMKGKEVVSALRLYHLLSSGIW